MTDITYIPTGEGWLYLAVILDLCSRSIVGWAIGDCWGNAVAESFFFCNRQRRHSSLGFLSPLAPAIHCGLP